MATASRVCSRHCADSCVCGTGRKYQYKLFLLVMAILLMVGALRLQKPQSIVSLQKWDPYLTFFNKDASTVPAYKPSTKVTFCTLAKNEGPYFREWLDYHKEMGVAKIALYDDGSTDGTKDTVNSYVGSGFVDYQNVKSMNCTTWPKLIRPSCEACVSDQGRAAEHSQHNCQVATILHCVETYSKTSDWLGFIDVDEYVFPCPVGNNSRRIPEVLKSFEKPQLHSDITLDCLTFGTSGYKKQMPESESLIATHTRRAPYNELGESEDKRRKELGCAWQHCVSAQILKHLSYSKSLDIKAISARAISVHETLAFGKSHKAIRHKKLCCNHYQFKSMEEVVRKTTMNKNPKLLERFKKPGADAYYNSISDTSAVEALKP